ncbi:MAG: TIGR04551 family protein [Myxococcota bacterium]|nr:TIGR04551 family protein [Myxococcota bacterium]
MRLFLTILMVLFGTGVATAQEDNSGGEKPAEASAEEPSTEAGDSANEGAKEEPTESGEAAVDPPASDSSKPEVNGGAVDTIALERRLQMFKLELLEEQKAGQSTGPGVPADWEERVIQEAVKPALKTFELKGTFRTRMDYMRGLDLGTAEITEDTFSGWMGSSSVPPDLFHDPNNGDGSPSTLESGNMRWRLEPTLNVSEDVQVKARIDLFDNVVLGTNPDSYPGLTANPSAPISLFSSSARSPEAGVNSPVDSIRVKQVYGDVLLPIGRLRFGRMPSNFGLGLLSNDGEEDPAGRHHSRGEQADGGDSADRIMFLTKLRGIILGAGWDFAGEGPFGGGHGTGANRSYQHIEGRQLYDLSEADDVDQYVFVVAKADRGEALDKLLASGKSSTNYGGYFVYREQRQDFPGPTSALVSSGSWYGRPFNGSFPKVTTDGVEGVVPRAATAQILSLWFRHLTRRLRVEAEVVGITAQVGSFATDGTQVPAEDEVAEKISMIDIDVRQLGAALETDYTLKGGKITVGFDTGYASGDSHAGWGLRPGTGQLGGSGARLYGDTRQFGCRDYEKESDATLSECGGIDLFDKNITNFRFDPSYRVDLILFREVIGGITDAYYFKPHIAYKLRPNLRLDGALIYSRAVFKESTPGDANDLGVEMDLGLRLELKNRFGLHLDYGLLLPLDGMDMARGVASRQEAQMAQRVLGTFLVRY